MLLVVLADHLATGHLEGLHAALRPTGSPGHNIGQHSQGLRVRQQPLDTPPPSGLDKGPGILDVRPGIQDRGDVRIRQGIEAQHLHLGIRCHGCQMLAVILPKPVRLPAGQPETRFDQGVELPPNLVEGRSHIRRAGPNLIKAVDEEGFAAPLRMVLRLEGQEVAGRDQAGIIPERRALRLERGRLTGARVTYQHVGRRIPELHQRPGLPFPGLKPILLPCRDLRACARDDHSHASPNHSPAGAVRNSLCGIPPSPTSRQRQRSKRRSNSSIPGKGLGPRAGVRSSPLFTSTATIRLPLLRTKSTS